MIFLVERSINAYAPPLKCKVILTAPTEHDFAKLEEEYPGVGLRVSLFEDDGTKVYTMSNVCFPGDPKGWRMYK